jgi:hypothetical protein
MAVIRTCTEWRHKGGFGKECDTCLYLPLSILLTKQMLIKILFTEDIMFTYIGVAETIVTL